MLGLKRAINSTRPTPLCMNKNSKYIYRYFAIQNIKILRIKPKLYRKPIPYGENKFYVDKIDKASKFS